MIVLAWLFTVAPYRRKFPAADPLLLRISRLVDRLEEMAPRFKPFPALFMFIPTLVPVVVLGKVAIPELDAAVPNEPALVLLTQLEVVSHAAPAVFELKVPSCEKSAVVNVRHQRTENNSARR
jgi:hypothetical protein